MIWLFVFGLAAYLIGAIPFAWVIARMNGVDIRQVGSGNVGATNVFRSLGAGWGILTFIADVAKGFVPTFFFPLWMADGGDTRIALAYGVLAIAGHNWPVYLRFKGGKGVATSAGVLLAVAPFVVGLGIVAWGLAFVTSRYVSVSSMAAALVIVGSGWWQYGRDNPLLATVLTVLGVLVVLRHHSNIRRLIAGTEPRTRLFSFTSK